MTRRESISSSQHRRLIAGGGPSSRRAGLLCAAAALALFATHASRANAAAAAPPPGASASVAEVIVTAQRRSENIQNVPVAINALSSKQIESLGIKSSSDLGRVTPNVSISLPNGEGNQPTINIRGIGLNDYNTNNAGPNGVYVDDVYISAPAEQAFAVFDLSQIQVLKGPQGTLYGRNTSGGGVVFTSNKPSDQFTADAGIDYGSFNTVRADAAIGGPIAAGLDGRVAVVVNHSDGFMHNDLDDKAVSGTDNEAFRLQLLYRPNDKFKLLFSSTVGWVDNLPMEYRHVGDFTPATHADPTPTVCSVAQTAAGSCVDLFGYGAPSNFYHGEFNRTQHLHVLNLLESLRMDYDFGGVTLSSISAFQHSDKFHPEDTDQSPEQLLEVDYGVKSNTYTQEFRAAHNEQAYNWQVGVFYLHEELHQDQPLYLFHDGDKYGGFGVAPGPGAFDGIASTAFDNAEQDTDSAAIYGQGDYNFHGLTLTLGGRYTYERKSFDYAGSTAYQDGGMGHFDPPGSFVASNQSKTDTNFTWRAALSYHFSSRILGYASAATGFKSTEFNGGFLSNVPEQLALQTKPVGPEHVTAFEVGAKSSFFDRRLILNASVFYNQYDDQQVFVNVPLLVNNPILGTIVEPTNILSNAKTAHTEGVELQIIAAPVPGLTIQLEPAYLNAQIDRAGIAVVAGSVPLDGKQMPMSPHWSFAGVVDYRMPILDGDHLDWQYDASYKDHQFFDSTNDPYTQQPGYWIQDVSLTYENRRGWDLGVYVKNLADTQYLNYAYDLTASFGDIEEVVGMPRQFGVRARYHF